MTHLEIILWLQENLVGLVQKINKKYTITYIDKEGMCNDHHCNDIISGVLSINGKELI